MFHNSVVGHAAPVLMARARAEAEKKLTEELHKNVRRAGWPEDVIPHLSVKHDGSNFQVHVAPEGEQKALELEYGTQERFPMGTLRQFTNRLPEMASKHAYNALSNAAEELM